MTKKGIHPNPADLRREAEKIARENADQTPENLLAITNGDHGDTLPQDVPMITQTLHELRVHQIELEMQNSALHQRQEELDAARARYFDLYELAPVGYVTVSKQGLLIEANLTAATMLGMLRGRPGHAHPIFSQFIHGEAQEIYFLFRKQLLETGHPQVCDLRMVKKDGPAFWAHLEATVAQDTGGEPVIRVVISDISAEQNLKEARNLLEQMVEERSKQSRQKTDAQPTEGADTILFVDDEPNVLSALTRTLRNSPYQVLTAGSAGEALEIMETTKIKVIVSDEQMVGMKGSELLAEVQKRFPHTLRILMSGHTTQEMAMRAVNEGGIYRFFAKPWDEAMLRLSLSAATEKYNSDAEKRRLLEELRKSHDLLEQRVEERTIQLRQEIEAHKRLQVTLQESEEKFRTFADWTYDWEYWINPQDRVFRYISPSVERITGYSRDAFLADPGLMDRIIHPDDRPLWDRNVEENRSKTDVSELTFRIITASGEVRWIGHECQAVTAADGRQLGRRSSNRDITRQKLAEETLLKSEERLQLAIQAADVGIWELDVVSNRLTWDETMCRFYGITPEKFGGRYEVWEAGLHPEDLPKSREAFQRALRGEGDYNQEFRVVWPDGSIHWMKTSARIERDSEGRPLRMLGMNLDITADKLLVEAAEAASRAKSLFIGNMSHELRTPLSGVLGMTEALLTTPLADKQRDYAETIRKSGKALLAVVSDILDFSKIEAGKMTLNSAPFLVESVIANVVNLFGPPAAEEKIGLHTTMDSEIPVLRGDTHRLTQVVNNLVGNAIKFTKKGEIQVTAKILWRTETEVELAIGVQDTGIGMTEEELSRIFTGFTQGDTTRGRRFGGTGLGLTISRNLVELMGGTLQVESVFGKGSLFTVLVTFPIAQGFAVSDLQFLQTSAPSAPINPVMPAPPPSPERQPGDMAELHALLEQLKAPLDRGEPRPCKEILAVLLAKSWPEEQETLLAELDRLVKRYRLQDALDLLNNGAAE
ncbi:MAG: PAS domain-containing protein [Syntrophales bacterium]